MSRIVRIDSAVARVELRLAALLLAGMLVVMAAGAVMRTAGRPLIWGDELAVLLMAVSALFGLSSNIATGHHIAVDLLARRLGGVADLLIGCLLLAATAGFAVCLVRWFDPAGLLRLGSVEVLARETMNFVYQEPTMTLGLRKAWFWAAFAPATLGAMLHALVLILRAGRGQPC